MQLTGGITSIVYSWPEDDGGLILKLERFDLCDIAEGERRGVAPRTDPTEDDGRRRSGCGGGLASGVGVVKY